MLRCRALLCAAIALAALAPHPARAEGERITAEEIRQSIIGRRIYLAAPIGGEFPLNYRPSGVVDGNGEALGIGRLVRPRDEGKWWIAGDWLCQQFCNWYKGATLCFELYRAGEGRLTWIRDNGQTGTARIGESL